MSVRGRDGWAEGREGATREDEKKMDRMVEKNDNKTEMDCTSSGRMIGSAGAIVELVLGALK